MKKSVVALCLMLHGIVFAQEWNTDLNIAKQEAIASNKTIFLVFTGSDWCTSCICMEKIVWQSPEFKAAAEKNWVLLRADFPQKAAHPEPVNVNDMKMILTEKYNRDGFFPYFVLLDKNGRVIKKNGYEDFETAEEYVTLFKQMAK